MRIRIDYNQDQVEGKGLDKDERDDKVKDKDGDLMVRCVKITGSNDPASFAERRVTSSAEEALIFSPYSLSFLGKIFPNLTQ